MPEWWASVIVGGFILYVAALVVSLTILHWRKICNALFGWAIRRYVCKRNDNLAACFIFAAMNDIEITDEMLERKRKLYARCVWWNAADPCSLADVPGPFAIRKKTTGQWLCYCSTTGEPVLRSGKPRNVGAELFQTRARALLEMQQVHPFYALNRSRFEIVRA